MAQYQGETMKQARKNRNYNESDASFLGKATAIINQLATALPDFAAFDATVFTREYVTTLLEKLQAIEEIHSDSVYRSILSEKTASMSSLMKRALREMQLAKYFIGKMCNHKKEVINSFGYSDLSKSRTKPDVVLSVFEGFVATMQSRGKELLALHYPRENLEQLPTLLHRFQEKRSEQRLFKKERPLLTSQRVALLNALFKEMQLIQHVASHYIFPEHPEKQALFSLK